MKFRDLVRHIEEQGCVFVRHGHDHDFYRSVITGEMQPVPRRREVNENTARAIIRQLAAPKSES